MNLNVPGTADAAHQPKCAMRSGYVKVCHAQDRGMTSVDSTVKLFWCGSITRPSTSGQDCSHLLEFSASTSKTTNEELHRWALPLAREAHGHFNNVSELLICSRPPPCVSGTQSSSRSFKHPLSLSKGGGTTSHQLRRHRRPNPSHERQS